MNNIFPLISLHITNKQVIAAIRNENFFCRRVIEKFSESILCGKFSKEYNNKAKLTEKHIYAGIYAYT